MPRALNHLIDTYGLARRWPIGRLTEWLGVRDGIHRHAGREPPSQADPQDSNPLRKPP